MIDNTLEMLKYKKRQMEEQIKQVSLENEALDIKRQYNNKRISELSNSIYQLEVAVEAIEQLEPNESKDQETAPGCSNS